jgi:hypothetical protein
MASEISAPTDVFINCPFDRDYAPQFEALIFGVMACGFRPRSARELDDGGQTRIEKLYGIIEECRYGVHDLSRTQLDAINDLPRFNMPLELGIFLGAKRFGGDGHQTKRALILDVEPYRHQRFISDLSGMDIADHGGDVGRTLVRLRDWLANVSRRKLAGGPALVATYQRFLAQKAETAVGLGLDSEQIPYVDFEQIATLWLAAERG